MRNRLSNSLHHLGVISFRIEQCHQNLGPIACSSSSCTCRGICPDYVWLEPHLSQHLNQMSFFLRENLITWSLSSLSVRGDCCLISPYWLMCCSIRWDLQLPLVKSCPKHFIVVLFGSSSWNRAKALAIHNVWACNDTMHVLMSSRRPVTKRMNDEVNIVIALLWRRNSWASFSNRV